MGYGKIEIMQTTIPWQKIKALEDEIKVLKSLGKKTIKKPSNKKNNLKGILKSKPSSIEGILKGVGSTWKDFKEAKKIWFDEEHILHQKHKK